MSRVDATERLILALDVPHDSKNPDRMIEIEDAWNLVERLDKYVSTFKIGWPLYMATDGPKFAEELVNRGKKVFLDLKFGDIAETVKRLVMVAVENKVSFLTVNTTFQTVRAAVQTSADSNLKILTVTLLTSLDKSDLDEMGSNTSVHDYVLHKARKAKECGCAGIICSGKDARSIRKETGDDFLIITPGIRPMGYSAEDHKRACTPEEAINAGADYLVVGRPIVRADAPEEIAQRMLEKMQTAFDQR